MDPGASTSMAVLRPLARTAVHASTLPLPEVTSAHAQGAMSVRRAMSMIHAAMVVRGLSVSSMAARVLQLPALDGSICTRALVHQGSTGQTVPGTIRVRRRHV